MASSRLIVPVNPQADWLEFCSTLLVLHLDDYLHSFLTGASYEADPAMHLHLVELESP